MQSIENKAGLSQTPIWNLRLSSAIEAAQLNRLGGSCAFFLPRSRDYIIAAYFDSSKSDAMALHPAKIMNGSSAPDRAVFSYGQPQCPLIGGHQSVIMSL